MDQTNTIVVPTHAVDRLPAFTPWRCAASILTGHSRWMHRPTAEGDQQFRQLIPSAVLTPGPGLYHSFRRSDKYDRAELNNRISIIIGGHPTDIDRGPTMLDTILNCLLREISEETDALPITTSPPAAIVTDLTDPNTAQHMAIVHVVRVDRPVHAVGSDEFIEPSSENGRVISPLQLSHPDIQLDPWTAILARHLTDLQPSPA